jgi:hypothetical protein
MLVAEHGGDTMLPRIGIIRALYWSKGAALHIWRKQHMS